MPRPALGSVFAPYPPRGLSILLHLQNRVHGAARELGIRRCRCPVLEATRRGTVLCLERALSNSKSRSHTPSDFDAMNLIIKRTLQGLSIGKASSSISGGDHVSGGVRGRVYSVSAGHRDVLFFTDTIHSINATASSRWHRSSVSGWIAGPLTCSMNWHLCGERGRPEMRSCSWSTSYEGR